MIPCYAIGIILCAEKDRVEVELALEDMGKPIGVADYQLIKGKSIAQFCFFYSKINLIVVFSREKKLSL